MSRIYRTAQGETWDQVAKAVYGSEKRAMDIVRANPAYLGTIFFSAGIELAIPDLAEPVDERTPPWLRN